MGQRAKNEPHKTAEELNKIDDAKKSWVVDVYCYDEECKFALHVPFGKTYEEYFSKNNKPICTNCGNTNIQRIVVNKTEYLKREPTPDNSKKSD